MSQIAEADRVVVEKPARGRSAVVCVQGDDVLRLVRGIASAMPDGAELGPDHDFAVLEFLKGTNQLAVLQCGPGRFWINGKGYHGNTGDLFDPHGGGPIHFRISNGFRGFIYFIHNARNGSDISGSNGVYRITVPADGIVTVRDRGVLYSWPETAQFMDGSEIPLSAQSEPVAELPSPDDTIALRSLGTFSANGLTFATFHLGTKWEFQNDRFANVAPMSPWSSHPPVDPSGSGSFFQIAVLAVLVLLCWATWRRLYSSRAPRR